MVEARSKVECELLAKLDAHISELRKKFTISQIDKYNYEVEQARNAYHKLIYAECDAIEQRYGYPPRLYKEEK